jgi:hypothetical protein
MVEKMSSFSGIRGTLMLGLTPTIEANAKQIKIR